MPESGKHDARRSAADMRAASEPGMPGSNGTDDRRMRQFKRTCWAMVRLAALALSALAMLPLLAGIANWLREANDILAEHTPDLIERASTTLRQVH